ncbi:MazG family protein [Sphaerochaeta pleomorpha str. Grapes]|uniref:MazG family protein n=1 Tax=Sphaerochaeta pleomorpha (strain ATCC BAA-1885 / DSM 22778 / Grapes) TaxID=158190 RepID=G8QW50_SPHPG|nr:nucleoside triphosphate pyrophosphohydrolase [Sphaerochaeta pleomorpha]AEV28293.1 MazG family protein [Sphaerochaeta pleomorpha str. Grapes]
MIEYTYKQAEDLQAALQQLFEIVTMLRSPEGCPWDREQTTKTVATSLMDETYEYLDAINANDTQGASEEIGDVMLNVMLLLEIHKEHNDFDIVGSINGVCEKLVRRHPHVFSTEHAENSTQVLDLWNKIKVEVEGKKASTDDFFSRVPKSLPPLEMANEIQKKIQKVGFDWPGIQGVVDKVKEELQEVVEANSSLDRCQADVELEIGDLLFSVVNLARYLHISPSVALHRSNRKVQKRFNEVARLCKAREITLSGENLAQMDGIWDEVKKTEKL